MHNPFAPLPSGHDNSLGTVLTQEVARFNTLLALLRNSLTELGRAMKGLAVMSPELEATGTSLLNGQVPALWQRGAYPSLKPLGAWVANFRARMAAMEGWLYQGEPSAFWLPGFFFPQGFLTAVLQNHARMRAIPIDRLSFCFDVTPHDLASEIKAAPAEGVFIHGLFMESVKWDKVRGGHAKG